MKVSYFPGCTLKTKARDLDIWAKKSMEALGVTLEELDAWQCCGGVYNTARDEIATKLSSLRALKAAGDQGQILVSVCSACHNVLKQTDYAHRNDPDFRDRADRYMGEEKYEDQTRVMHLLELVRDEVGYDTVKEKVVKPLTGKKIAAYYGCLLLRPGKVMAMDDPENPRILEDLLAALGAQPVIDGNRNECCGGYLAIEDKAAAQKRSHAVMAGAENKGAEMIVTACPLCKYNLERNGGGTIPVLYITELLADALGVKEAGEDDQN